MLHWLGWQESADGIEVRGESLQVAVVYPAADLAVVRLRHRTLHQAWTECGGELCLSILLTPLRSDVVYLWSLPLGASLEADSPRSLPACDPPPSPARVSDERSAGFAVFRHLARQPSPDDTIRVSCAFRARRHASLRLRYAAAESLALAPARAAASAVVNNPLAIRLFE
jgi:hypothetical protein